MSDRAPGLIARVGTWTAAHRRVSVVAWIGAVVLAMAVSHAAGPRYVNNLSLPGTDSQRATDVLAGSFRAQAGDTDQIVLHSLRGPITDPAIRTAFATITFDER